MICIACRSKSRAQMVLRRGPSLFSHNVSKFDSMLPTFESSVKTFWTVHRSIEVDVQVGAIKAIPAVGTGHFTILFEHLVTAAVTEISAFFLLLIFPPMNGF